MPKTELFRRNFLVSTLSFSAITGPLNAELVVNFRECNPFGHGTIISGGASAEIRREGLHGTPLQCVWYSNLRTKFHTLTRHDSQKRPWTRCLRMLRVLNDLLVRMAGILWLPIWYDIRCLCIRFQAKTGVCALFQCSSPTITPAKKMLSGRSDCAGGTLQLFIDGYSSCSHSQRF